MTGSSWGFKCFERLFISANSNLVKKYWQLIKFFDMYYLKMEFIHQLAEVDNNELMDCNEQKEEKELINYFDDFINNVNNFQNYEAQS